MSNRKRIWLYSGGLVIAVFAYVGGIAAAYWIKDTDVMKTRRMEAEIAAKIAEIPSAVTNKQWNAEELGVSIWKKIDALPDDAKKEEWCRKAFDVTFNVELGHLPPGRQYGAIRRVEDMSGQIANAWCKLANPYNRWAFERRERQWDIKFRYLAWMKQQGDRCRRECAEAEAKARRVRPIPLSIANRAAGFRGLVKSVEGDYWQKLWRRELEFWEYREEVLPESWTKAQHKFEALLGRPLRTREQLEADRQRKAEAFRRAEEAAQSGTNRPPPLILIDGTK